MLRNDQQDQQAKQTQWAMGNPKAVLDFERRVMDMAWMAKNKVKLTPLVEVDCYGGSRKMRKKQMSLNSLVEGERFPYSKMDMEDQANRNLANYFNSMALV